jgi:hypothetical protein
MGFQFLKSLRHVIQNFQGFSKWRYRELPNQATKQGHKKQWLTEGSFAGVACWGASETRTDVAHKLAHDAWLSSAATGGW